MVAAEDFDEAALLFILNAVSFKGAWTLGFDRAMTELRDFTLPGGRMRPVPMMRGFSEQYLYFREKGFQAVGLPYGNGRVTMYVFVPERDSSLEAFHLRLNSRNWVRWMSGFSPHGTSVVLPRFTVKYAETLNNALSALGMGVAFESGADFRGICPDGLFIDFVKHKAVVEVDEEGTTAAAATVVKMKKGPPAPAVIADRPFFFAIRDNETGRILFMGSVVEPQ
jgi:serpin B